MSLETKGMKNKVHPAWRTAAIIIAGFLVVAYFALRSFVTDHEKTDHASLSISHNMELQLYKALDRLEKDSAAIRTKMDSVRHRSDSVIQHRERRIAALQGRRAPVSVIIAADSLEFTRAQLENRDSTIDEQSGVISDLKGKFAITSRMEDEEDSVQNLKLGDWTKFADTMQHQRDSAIVETGKIDRRWKRKRRLERIGEAAIVVVVILLAL